MYALWVRCKDFFEDRYRWCKSMEGIQGAVDRHEKFNSMNDSPGVLDTHRIELL